MDTFNDEIIASQKHINGVIFDCSHTGIDEQEIAIGNGRLHVFARRLDNDKSIRWNAQYIRYQMSWEGHIAGDLFVIYNRAIACRGANIITTQAYRRRSGSII